MSTADEQTRLDGNREWNRHRIHRAFRTRRAELRYAPDGRLYEAEEFADHFGGPEEWTEAPVRRNVPNGEPYSKEEYAEYFGDLRGWREATTHASTAEVADREQGAQEDGRKAGRERMVNTARIGRWPQAAACTEARAEIDAAMAWMGALAIS